RSRKGGPRLWNLLRRPGGWLNHMSRLSTAPLWREPEAPRYPELREDRVADVCVIGAGVAGLTTAYMLVREGRSVALLERGPIAGGETARTTAHLSNALDDRYFNLEKLFGRSGSKLAQESHAAAIDHIERLCVREDLDCDFTRLDGYLFAPPGESPALLECELNAARRAGLAGVERMDRAPLAGFDPGPCLRFPRQAQFDPLRYARGLARAVERAGGWIFTHSPVLKLEGGAHPSAKTTTGKTVSAGAIVVATNTPIHDNLAIHS